MVLGLLIASGCKLTGRRGPVPEAVAAARELSQQGVAANQQGRLEEAQQLFARAVEACPTDVEARRQLAESLWQRGDALEAVAQMEQALQLDPENVALLVRAGEMYLVMRDTQRVRRITEKVLDLDVSSGPAWALRGRLREAEGDLDQALADYHQALRQMPDDKQVLHDVAELYRQRNQPQRALIALAHLAEVYPPGEEPAEVLYLTGLAYAALGRHDDAVESYYAASVRGQPTAELMYRLAEAEQRAGRPAAARANVQQALAIDPQHFPSRALYEQLQVAAQPATMTRSR